MKLADRIHESIAAGDFPEASRHFDEYIRGVVAAIERGTCTAALMEEADQLVRRSRQMVLATRAHLNDQFQDLRTRTYISGVYRTRE
jgi:hypothetical protein